MTNQIEYKVEWWLFIISIIRSDNTTEHFSGVSSSYPTTTTWIID